MSLPVAGFRNAILCEDIRDEVGNKKSLMGVFGGDIVVSELPATIYVAIYVEFVQPDEQLQPIIMTLRIMSGDNEIAKADVKSDKPQSVMTIVLPRALIKFDTETVFRVLATTESQPEIEILSKRVRKGPIP